MSIGFFTRRRIARFLAAKAIDDALANDLPERHFGPRTTRTPGEMEQIRQEMQIIARRMKDGRSG